MCHYTLFQFVLNLSIVWILQSLYFRRFMEICFYTYIFIYLFILCLEKFCRWRLSNVDMIEPTCHDNSSFFSFQVQSVELWLKYIKTKFYEFLNMHKLKIVIPFITKQLFAKKIYGTGKPTVAIDILGSNQNWIPRQFR